MWFESKVQVEDSVEGLEEGLVVDLEEDLVVDSAEDLVMDLDLLLEVVEVQAD